MFGLFPQMHQCLAQLCTGPVDVGFDRSEWEIQRRGDLFVRPPLHVAQHDAGAIFRAERPDGPFDGGAEFLGRQCVQRVLTAGIKIELPLESVISEAVNSPWSHKKMREDVGDDRLMAGIDITKKFVEACQAKSGKILPYISTNNSVRDMESIRRALGEAGHASIPTLGRNAVPMVAELIRRIDAHRTRKRLVPAIKKVLNAAIDADGSSLRDYVQTSGELGVYQNNFAVYDREGQACPDCTCH